MRSATSERRKPSILTTRIRIKPLCPPPGHPDYRAPAEASKSAGRPGIRKQEQSDRDWPESGSCSSSCSSNERSAASDSLDRGLHAAGQSREQRATRIHNFLTEMANDSVRVNYVLRVDEHVSRSLENAKSKESRSGKRGNRNKSQQSQMTESKEKIDVTSPDSILSHVTNPRLLFNPSTFAALPLYFQYKLVQSLPACDQLVTEQGWVKPSASSLTNEFFSKACAAWFDNLKEGRFAPEYLQRKKQETEREKGKIDPWKLRHFEPIWGLRQKSQQVSLSEYDRIPRIVLPDRFPPPASPQHAAHQDAGGGAVTERVTPVRQFNSAVACKATPAARPRPLSKQRQLVQPAVSDVSAGRSAGRSAGHETADVIADTRIVPAATSSLPANSADSSLQQLKDEKAAPHSEERSQSGASLTSTEEKHRNAVLVPEIESPEQREGMAFSAVPGDCGPCPSPVAQTSSGEQMSELPDRSAVRSSGVIASPDKQMSKESVCPLVSPIRTRSQRKQRTGAVMTNSQGIDEQRSINICKKVVARSANNKLFFVTQRGSIQQLNNEQDHLSQQDADDSMIPTPALVKTLPNDTEIFPISNQNHGDADKCLTKTQLTVMSVNGFRGDQENIPTGLQSSILCSILSNSRSATESDRLPLSYKLPDGITITPMTSSNSSNQVPVITRTELLPPSESQNTGSWSSSLSSLQTPSTNSEQVLEELTRIPKQITVIPLGPSAGVDLPVEGEGNEDELEMEQDEVEDVDQMMGSTSSDCVCSLKALIQCSKCGALCHAECIGPSGICVRCLVRVNNHTISYMQSVPIIANANASQTAYVYPI